MSASPYALMFFTNVFLWELYTCWHKLSFRPKRRRVVEDYVRKISSTLKWVFPRSFLPSVVWMTPCGNLHIISFFYFKRGLEQIVYRDNSWRNILNCWRRVRAKLLKNWGNREDVFLFRLRVFILTLFFLGLKTHVTHCMSSVIRWISVLSSVISLVFACHWCHSKIQVTSVTCDFCSHCTGRCWFSRSCMHRAMSDISF